MSYETTQGSKFFIQDEGPGTMSPVTAATRAKPCVLTVTGATIAAGDVVIPRGTGLKSIDDQAFNVSAVAAGSITLEDSDTSKEAPGTAVTAGAQLEEAVMIEWCRTNVTVGGPAGTTVDVTTLCDMEHKIEAGLPGINTWAANGFSDINEPGMLRARDARRNAEKVALKAEARTGWSMTWMGTVQVFDMAAALNAAWTANASGQVSGQVNINAAP